MKFLITRIDGSARNYSFDSRISADALKFYRWMKRNGKIADYKIVD